MPIKKNLEAWDVSEQDFPHNGPVAEKLRFCLRYAILAPSTYNNQPWAFEIQDDTVSVFADRRLGLPVLDPDDRELFMSCGSALFNLRLAIRYFGYEENAQLLPNPADENLIARVHMGQGGQSVSEEDKALFKAIPERQINKGAYKDKPVPEDVLERLRQAAKKENAWLYVCEGDERDVIAHFVAEGDSIQMNNKSFRRELASWMNERRYSSGDGLPNYARKVREIMKTSKPRIIRRFEKEPSQVVQDDEIAAGCPVIAILGTERGGAVNRIYTGQAYMRVFLAVVAEGLELSTMNQPCEVPDLRLRLYDEIGHQLGRAQMVLRIGYGDRSVNVTPRRPLETFIDDSYVSHVSPANDQGRKDRKSIWSKFQKLFLAK